MRRPRWRREFEILFGFWLLPLVVALLPYRRGLALARWLAARLPLYDAVTCRAWEQCAAVRPDDERRWKAGFRLTQLIDHADLFWSLTRSDRWILARMALQRIEPSRARGLLVIGFHYGQGLWLLRWLRAVGVPSRFVSIRFTRADFETTAHYLYARLRMWAVARAEGAAPIYTGGGRRAIGDTLAGGGCVFGLVDVAMADARERAANATLFDRPIVFPEGLLDSSQEVDPPVLILTARHDDGELRRVDATSFPATRGLTMPRIARELEVRIEAAPSAWHVWGLWPLFRAGE